MREKLWKNGKWKRQHWLLRMLYVELGAPVSAIAELLNRDEDAVECQIRHLNLRSERRRKRQRQVVMRSHDPARSYGI